MTTAPHALQHASAPSARALLRAAAIGAATGGRSTAGPAAVALSSRPGDAGPAGLLGARGATIVSALLAAGEVTADKHPAAPPRTTVAGLVPRIAAAAGAAATAARRDGEDAVVAGIVGAGTAAAAAVLGVRARAALQHRLGTDVPGAIAEDVLVAALGWWGTRRVPVS